MAVAQKYLFDRNFEAPEPEAEPPEAVLERNLRQEFEQTIADTKASAYEQGRADGAMEALESIEARTEKAAGEVVEGISTLLRRLNTECASIRAEAIRVAVAAAERLAGELIAREPTTLLESLFAECLEEFADAPHIAVRVNDALSEDLQERFARIARERGITGQIIVIGDPETARSDCRIEWADGGVSRNFESLRLGVTEIVERYLAGNTPDGPMPGRDENGAKGSAENTLMLESGETNE